MIVDYHSHTYYSFCGRDCPKDLVELAVKSGVDIFGISDHNYGIGDRKKQYYSEIKELAEKNKGKIRLLCGIEIATERADIFLLPEEDISFFDYCLIEHIDRPSTVMGEGIFEFSKKCGTRTGVAHTDLIAYAEKINMEPLELLKKFAEHNIFWEMNVNFDSIHNFQEHRYVKNFLTDKTIQEVVKKSGITLSVGFDGHRKEDYLIKKVVDMNNFLDDNGFKKLIL